MNQQQPDQRPSATRLPAGVSRQPATGQQAPVLDRLDSPSGSGGGWRLAAVLLGLSLVGVIVVGRLGMDERPDVVASPLPLPTNVAQVTPSSGPAESPAPTGRPAPPPDFELLPDVPRHLDGIPTSIGGERVFRVGNALLRGGEHMLLVGGWYLAPDCLRVRRCVGRLAESPAAAHRSQQSVALVGPIDPNSGPRVVRAVVREACLERTAATCLPTMDVLDIVWTGDLFTRAGPVAAQSLLGALSFAFPAMRAEPFRDVARCSVPWPPQTYRSTAGGPRMTLIFPSTEDRLNAEQLIRESWPLPPAGSQGQCTDHFMSLPEPGDWLAEDNVMIWAGQDEGQVALARAAIQDARAQSGLAPGLTPAPLTSWAALSALRGWETGLDLLPPHDYLVWGGDLPDEAYALNDPLLRVMIVFPSEDERRTFQRRVRAIDVIVLRSLPPTEPAVGSGLLDARQAEVRWLGFQNVLLQVAGPESFDDRLREVLADSLR